jgi:ABC-type lipoprotein export system ATPase subunit
MRTDEHGQEQMDTDKCKRVRWRAVPVWTQADGPQIELRQVVKRYEGQGGAVTALKGIDLQVERGEFLVITGKSSAGKTTLVNVLAGLDRLTSGQVWVAGTPLHRLKGEQAARWRRRTVGVIFQTFELLPSLTVLQNVTLPMAFAHRYTPRERRNRALHLLDMVEIAEHAHKRPGAVSGGQQQRVAIARAMANDPAILVADEPTGSLDSVTADAVLRVFERLIDEEEKTVILVTHDFDIARRGTRRVHIADGQIADEGA